MEETILIAVSPYLKKYYINDKYNDLPEEMKEWLIAKLGALAEKSGSTIFLGFNDADEMYLTYQYENPNFSDDIGAQLLLKKFKKEEEEVLNSLKAWYMLYHTEEGEKLQKAIYKQIKNY